MDTRTIERQSILNARHRELGSALDGELWNHTPLPWRYRTDPHEEVIATRTRAALYDVSALNIVHVRGPDAQDVLNRLVCIDVARLKPGSARLGAEVDHEGALADDVMLIRDAADAFRVSHGSGGTPAALAELASGKRVSIEPDRDVHALSLQGPASLGVLAPHCAAPLAGLRYMDHVSTTLFGLAVVISRGGYSGERGYEIFCASRDAIRIWDAILEIGKSAGVVAASWSALELTRVEAALLFYPFDMPEGDVTPWEANMHWAVDLDKTAEYTGKKAVLRLRGRERFRQAGLAVEHGDAVAAGSEIFIGRDKVGVVTSASYSRFLMQSLAMVHLVPSAIHLGTRVSVRSEGIERPATVVRTPFYDPLRLRTQPEGRAR
ncbi:MAG TPA: aminomethyltransferase family protein [Burkholderiaceae bacterium]|jgi:aminomethyltransferase|nr:aminomethyltransferase family protein [Burkholderiaceae bacterium]